MAKSIIQNKIVDPESLPKVLQSLRESNQTICTLNGAFDLLHVGHLAILEQASQQADRLIVCVNTDVSIKTYKNSNRPIVSLNDRAWLLASLVFVDYVTWFADETPCRILDIIRPHVHVNGSEYGKDCVESATIKKYGGRIHIAPLLPGKSTSKLIEKIQCVS
jgi:rfaE bifunctional protein nucleotidyltransferase chain/domain